MVDGGIGTSLYKCCFCCVFTLTLLFLWCFGDARVLDVYTVVDFHMYIECLLSSLRPLVFAQKIRTLPL